MRSHQSGAWELLCWVCRCCTHGRQNLQQHWIAEHALKSHGEHIHHHKLLMSCSWLHRLRHHNHLVQQALATSVVIGAAADRGTDHTERACCAGNVHCRLRCATTQAAPRRLVAAYLSVTVANQGVALLIWGRWVRCVRQVRCVLTLNGLCYDVSMANACIWQQHT